MNSLYLSPPILICFDDDTQFTPEQQAKLNNMLAENKRSLRSQLEKTERQLAELNESKNLSEQERESLAEALEETRSQLRTREENEKLERQRAEAKHKKELDGHKRRADEAEQKLNTATIHTALRDAAVAEDAFNPAILVEVLRERTTISPDGGVLVEFASKDAETGKELVEHLSPADAVKRLKGQPDRYGGLFRQFVAPKENTKPNKIDYKTMTPEQYRELRRTNPGALGL